MMAQATQTRIMAAEYAQLPETTQPMELINGEIVQMPAPKQSHQRLVVRLVQLLTGLISGGELAVAPMDVYLDDLNVVQPDVFLVSGPESRCKLGEDDWWHGAPDLVIEVFSPSTAVHDKREKFQLYEKHGVREYWMVDPILQFVEVWELAEQKFQHKGIYAASESFASSVLGAQNVDLSAIFVEAKREE